LTFSAPQFLGGQPPDVARFVNRNLCHAGHWMFVLHDARGTCLDQHERHLSRAFHMPAAIARSATNLSRMPKSLQPRRALGKCLSDHPKNIKRLKANRTEFGAGAQFLYDMMAKNFDWEEVVTRPLHGRSPSVST